MKSFWFVVVNLWGGAELGQMFKDVSHVLVILLSEARPFVQFLQSVCAKLF